ncbi:MAG: 30S ribosomal protein S16 [Candidatus Yanofskybacteria bacterium]|nr:30S ribosomal protein S16 [Candidatus Yanofskybacteria bacterium]
MLKIRLQRIGKRGQAYFRVVVTEHTQKPKGQYLELLGSYDPHKNEMNVNAEKVKHWLSKGAKMSETVNNLLVGRGVIEGEKVTVWKPKRKPATPEQTAAPAAKTEIKEPPKEEVKNEEPMTEAPKEELKEEKKEEAAPAVAEIPTAS